MRLELDLTGRGGDAKLTTLEDANVTELAVRAATTGDLNEGRLGNAPRVIAAIAARPRPALRILEIVEVYLGLEGAATAREWLEETPRECEHQPDVLWSRLPNLERATLGGLGMFHAISAPRLRSLALEDVPLCDRGEWRLPALESLAWKSYWVTTGYASDCELEHLESLWERDLPALRELVLDGSFVQQDAAIELPEVRDFIARLDRLEAPAGFFAGYDQRWEPTGLLIANADRLEHLSRLVVTQTEELAEAERAALLARLPHTVLDPYDPS